jgi:hypothetical protein
MAQISLYIDAENYKKIKSKAKKSGKSVSAWAKEKLIGSMDSNLLLKNLFGAIDDASFKKPQELGLSLDSKREKL